MDKRPTFLAGGNGTSPLQRLTGEQIKRFWSKVAPEPHSGCWLWMAGCFGTGYGAFSIGHKNYEAHRRAFVLNGGDITKEKPHVLHSCNVRACVNPNHLRAGTPRDNVADMVNCGDIARGDRHGSRLHPETRPRGEDHPMVRLTAGKVSEIRRSYKPFVVTRNFLARKYGVSPATIEQVLSRKTWRTIGNDK